MKWEEMHREAEDKANKGLSWEDGRQQNRNKDRMKNKDIMSIFQATTVKGLYFVITYIMTNFF
jgi:hypothetical protein